jgi:hypothetical protein
VTKATRLRPRCSKCGQWVSHGLWRVYSNGTVHLLPYCADCKRQTDVGPLPKRLAETAFADEGQVTRLVPTTEAPV